MTEIPKAKNVTLGGYIRRLSLSTVLGIPAVLLANGVSSAHQPFGGIVLTSLMGALMMRAVGTRWVDTDRVEEIRAHWTTLRKSEGIQSWTDSWDTSRVRYVKDGVDITRERITDGIIGLIRISTYIIYFLLKVITAALFSYIATYIYPHPSHWLMLGWMVSCVVWATSIQTTSQAFDKFRDETFVKEEKKASF